MNSRSRVDFILLRQEFHLLSLNLIRVWLDLSIPNLKWTWIDNYIKKSANLILIILYNLYSIIYTKPLYRNVCRALSASNSELKGRVYQTVECTDIDYRLWTIVSLKNSCIFNLLFEMAHWMVGHMNVLDARVRFYGKYKNWQS